MTVSGEPPSLRLTALVAAFGGDPRPGAPGIGPVDLEVAPGERLVLVGASGEGKTTLLRTVAGLLPARSGRIEVGGIDATSLPPERRGAVYLHQSPVLFPHLTVEENVAFPLRVRGVPRGEIRARVREALESVRLDGLASRGPGALSGGQRHRVALARAVVAEPALLLLDEPLSSLDPQLRHEVRDALLRLQERYRPGVVLVTHDLEEAGLLGHRVGLVMGGRIAQLEAPDRLFLAPGSLAVARFLGYRNEVSLDAGNPLARALSSHGLGGDATAAPPPPGPVDAARTGAPPRVAVLPPGACWIDVNPERPGDPWIRVPARALSVHHPGAEARVRIEVEGGPPVRLEVGVPPGSEVAAGSVVDLVVDPRRVCVFAPAAPEHPRAEPDPR
jgi:putative spermidine/putrescine transport system ATP-binding protein